MRQQDFPTSVLTGTQREFLRGESDITPAGERSIRRNIRERLHASIYDIRLIISELDTKDIDKALSDPDDVDLEKEDLEPLYSVPPIASCMDSLAALLFLGVGGASQTGDEQELLDNFLGHVASGIKTAAPHRGDSIDTLELTGTLRYGTSLEALSEQELSELSYDELTQLLVAEEIGPEQFAAVIEAKLE